MDFNFTHFTNFKFAYFEMELAKLTKWPISLANFHFGYLKGTHFIFAHFVYKGNFGEIWIKIID